MNFKDYLKNGEVKIQSKDENLAESLTKESFDRAEFIKRLIKNSENPKYIIENIYDLLREIIEAKLALDGFKSYSHEATIFYLKKFKEITDVEIKFLDELRKIRNKIKYYGKNIDKETANKAVKFMEEILPKLKRLINKNEK